MTIRFYSWRYLYRPNIVICLLLAGLSQSLTHKVQDNVDVDDRVYFLSNATALSQQKRDGVCVDGLILEAWKPVENISVGQRVGRGCAYFGLLVYLFIGVAIVSDNFMAAIEVITCSERKIVTKKWNGRKEVTVVRVWNDTVANLTLMALGSSAPEILLTVIELFQKKFEAGDLGPGTVVGSAAYNMFVIIAICISTVPSPDVRRIKHFRVFLVTVAWSLFAYIWLYAMLAWISPGLVEIWEGLLTLLFFAATVLHAYIAERKLLCYKRSKKKQTRKKHRVSFQPGRGVEIPISDSDLPDSDETTFESRRSLDSEKERQEYIRLLKKLRDKYPLNNIEQLQMKAQEQRLSESRRTRAFYRARASLALIGSRKMRRKSLLRVQSEVSEPRTDLVIVDVNKDEAPVRVFFDPDHYTVMEGCGDFRIRVLRHGDMSLNTKVEYHTRDGTAKAGTDYIAKKGILSFPPGVEELFITIEVIDDEVFEEDEQFYVHLHDPSAPAKLCTPHVATVLVLDDDHFGVFSFSEKDHELKESVGVYELIVKRYSGARGKVLLSYWTEDGTAYADKDYQQNRGELVFENNEAEKRISINIIEEGSFEKDVVFYVNIGEPIMAPDDKRTQMVQLAKSKAPNERDEQEEILLLGQPKIGDVRRAELRIKESDILQNTVDRLLKRTNAALLLGTSSWRERFTEGLTLPAVGEDDSDDDEGGSLTPSCVDYIMHFVTLFWKILFSLIPPAGLYDGYLCFMVSLLIIAFLTAIIADAASHFGCTVGMSDALTAISLLSIGTSIPDTFASRIAALQDKTADNSIGNVTGSNAVNVFVGIGVAWTLGAIYHRSYGRDFQVLPGSLAFAITIYFIGAIICIAVIFWRRKPTPIGGELGGPLKYKILHSGLFVLLYILYILLSALESYEVIKGF